MREKNRRSRGINYNNEVAFEKRPAPGFFDTAGEQATTREVGREFRPTTVEEIEGKRPRVRCQPTSFVSYTEASEASVSMPRCVRQGRMSIAI
jgi:hypothetical protein